MLHRPLKQTKTAMREHSLNLNLQLQGENTLTRFQSHVNKDVTFPMSL
jgi:hypothetical protein